MIEYVVVEPLRCAASKVIKVGGVADSLVWPTRL
jgi:hypothetical protein